MLESPEKIGQLVERAVELGATDLFVQVHRGGRSWFPSTHADDAPYRAMRARDPAAPEPLTDLIARAHARGPARARLVQLPGAGRAIASRRSCSGWGAARCRSTATGRSLLDYPDGNVPPPEGAYFELETPGLWLDPAVPGVVEYLAGTVDDLVARRARARRPAPRLHPLPVRAADDAGLALPARARLRLRRGRARALRARSTAASSAATPGTPSAARACASWSRRCARRCPKTWQHLGRGDGVRGPRLPDRRCRTGARWLDEGWLDFAVAMAYTRDDRAAALPGARAARRRRRRARLARARLVAVRVRRPARIARADRARARGDAAGDRAVLLRRAGGEARRVRRAGEADDLARGSRVRAAAGADRAGAGRSRATPRACSCSSARAARSPSCASRSSPTRVGPRDLVRRERHARACPPSCAAARRAAARPRRSCSSGGRRRRGPRSCARAGGSCPGSSSRSARCRARGRGAAGRRVPARARERGRLVDRRAARRARRGAAAAVHRARDPARAGPRRLPDDLRARSRRGRGADRVAALHARRSPRSCASRAITLHVGPGTFQPIRCERLEDHALDAERFAVPESTARAIAADARRRRARDRGRDHRRARARDDRRRCRRSGDTKLLILPGHAFRAVDALITNFHLPGSTLLALVMAFAGVEATRRAYAHAIARALPLLLVRGRAVDPLSARAALRARARDGRARARTARARRTGCSRRRRSSRSGRYGAVRGLTPDELARVGVQGAAREHLSPAPAAGRGAGRRDLGGLHGFMGWDGPILTDSGGFQVFSLGAYLPAQRGGRRVPQPARRTRGVPVARARDRDPGGARRGSDRRARRVRGARGRRRARRTRAHARCLERTPALGRALPRRASARGPAPVRDRAGRRLRRSCAPRARSARASSASARSRSAASASARRPRARDAPARARLPRALPPGAPRYLMGLGLPEDLVAGGARAASICSTAWCRPATGDTARCSRARGRLNLRNARHRDDDEPIDADCACPTCRRLLPRVPAPPARRWATRSARACCRCTTSPTT